MDLTHLDSSSEQMTYNPFASKHELIVVVIVIFQGNYMSMLVLILQAAEYKVQ